MELGVVRPRCFQSSTFYHNISCHCAYLSSHRRQQSRAGAPGAPGIPPPPASLQQALPDFGQGISNTTLSTVHFPISYRVQLAKDQVLSLDGRGRGGRERSPCRPIRGRVVEPIKGRWRRKELLLLLLGIGSVRHRGPLSTKAWDCEDSGPCCVRVWPGLTSRAPPNAARVMTC